MSISENATPIQRYGDREWETKRERGEGGREVRRQRVRDKEGERGGRERVTETESESEKALGRRITEVSAVDKVFMTLRKFSADIQELHTVGLPMKVS